MMDFRPVPCPKEGCDHDSWDKCGSCLLSAVRAYGERQSRDMRRYLLNLHRDDFLKAHYNDGHTIRKVGDSPYCVDCDLTFIEKETT